MTKRILLDKESGRILQFQDTSLFNYAPPGESHEVIEISEDDWSALARVDEVDDEVQGMKVKRYIIRPKLAIKEKEIVVDKTSGLIYEKSGEEKEPLFRLKKFKSRVELEGNG